MSKPKAGRSGRHALGRPWERVGRRRWDAGRCAQAAYLDRLEPGWSVMYGLSGRRFYAFAAFDAPYPLIIWARTVDELRERMRQAEREVIAGRPV